MKKIIKFILLNITRCCLLPIAVVYSIASIPFELLLMCIVNLANWLNDGEKYNYLTRLHFAPGMFFLILLYPDIANKFFYD